MKANDSSYTTVLTRPPEPTNGDCLKDREIEMKKPLLTCPVHKRKVEHLIMMAVQTRTDGQAGQFIKVWMSLKNLALGSGLVSASAGRSSVRM